MSTRAVDAALLHRGHRAKKNKAATDEPRPKKVIVVAPRTLPTERELSRTDSATIIKHTLNAMRGEEVFQPVDLGAVLGLERAQAMSGLPDASVEHVLWCMSPYAQGLEGVAATLEEIFRVVLVPVLFRARLGAIGRGFNVQALAEGTRLRDVPTEPSTCIGALLVLSDPKVDGVRVPNDVLTVVRLRATGADLALQAGAAVDR